MSPETQPLTEWEIDLREQTSLGIDLTKDVPCDAENCNTTAAWGTYPGCGHPRLGCTPCREQTDAWFRDHPWVKPVCFRCEKLIPNPIQWRPI